MLSSNTTADLLDQITLCTGNDVVDAVIESSVRLYLPEIRELLVQRDAALKSWGRPSILGEEALEVLSELIINVDEKLSSLACMSKTERFGGAGGFDAFGLGG